MIKVRFSDNDLHHKFNPLTLTRPVVDLRFGILTIRETWALLFKSKQIEIEAVFKTEPYLQEKYPNTVEADLEIAGNCKPSKQLLDAILLLNENESLTVNGRWIATKGKKLKQKSTVLDDCIWLGAIWELFQKNDQAIALDFELLTTGLTSEKISTSNQVINPEHIFIAPGAKIECAILNASQGPIYISENAEVMEGSMIRGPFSLGIKSTVKMGAKIYGATTIGPECKVGGEISNCIIQGYSNKGHDGFIGNSIIGEWCNLGADTNSSNLKNNYGPVKIYDFKTKALKLTDLLFCGLLMGDHSKTGINTMLNTATSVGVSANIFGAEFPPKYIPSFSWGVTQPFKYDRAIEVAENMMKRRGIELSMADRNLLKHLFEEG